MANDTSRPVWPLLLIGIAAVGVYAYLSIDLEPDAVHSRPVGDASDLAALAERDDTNVLFILVDTLRAHRMSAYGYERDTTPFMSALAETGIRFDHHIAQSSWTKTSMASLWSSLNPTRAGVTKFEHTLSTDIEMPAEILSRAGFTTVGLYRNGWVNGYFGFDQGFDKYYRPSGNFVDVEEQRLRPNAGAHGTDETVISDGIEFLRIHGKTSRWFLYLHLMDLHEYTYDKESALFGNGVDDIYDNSILRTDWVISTLFDYMSKQRLLENTIVVILSDHGEAFGERGFEGHARSVFPETTETPLIVTLPFRLEEAVVVRNRTSNVDVWPTILDLIGLGGQQGEIDGRSRRDEILAIARGENPERDAEDGETAIAFLDENWGRPTGEPAPAVSVLEGPYRYVAGTDFGGKAFELLLSRDDGQQLDRMALEPEVGERLREKALSHAREEPVYEAEDVELDEMQLDQLRALGYELP